MIQSGRVKYHIDAIRAEKDEKKREVLKRNIELAIKNRTKS
jgi:hypothetical protein